MFIYEFIGHLFDSHHDLWLGKIPLARAFWGYFIGGSILLAPIASLFIALLFRMMDQPAPEAPLILLTIIGYPLFAAVGAWRSANRYLLDRQNPNFIRHFWPLLAKLGIIVVVLGLAQRIFGASLWSMLARI